MEKLTPEQIRNLLPTSLKERTYFDSSSTTLITTPVIDAIKEFYFKIGTRRFTGVYPSSFQAQLVVENTKTLLSKILNSSNDLIAFTPSNVISVFHSLEILITEQPNTSILYTNDLENDFLLPIRNFSNLYKIKAFQIDILKSFQEQINKLLEFEDITENIILILPAYSLVGELYDKLSLIELLKSLFSVRVILNSTLLSGVNLDHDLLQNADIAIFDTNIGWGGPIGQSFLKLTHPYDIKKIYFQGSGTVKNVQLNNVSNLKTIEILETSLNPSIIYGLNIALNQYLNYSLKVSEYIMKLTTEFRKQISEIDRILCFNRTFNKNKTPVTSFVIQDLNSHEVAVFLDEMFKIDIRSGYFCSHQLVRALTNKFNTEGILQVSFNYYNLPTEINRLSNALKECIKAFS